MKDNKLRRSILYASASNGKNLVSSQFYGADSILIDLEDSVQMKDKDYARLLVFNFLTSERVTDTELMVRVNDINSDISKKDLEAMVLAQPDVIRFPKIETADDVKKADEIITELENKYGIESGKTKIIAGVENVLGVSNINEIAKASKRTIAVSIGGEDYSVSMGANRTKESWELFFARNAVVMAARLADIQVYDTVYANFKDTEGLIKETEFIKDFGFDGKYLIHPNQVKPVNDVFTPTDQEIEKAINIKNALKEANESSSGVIKLDGEMIDKPIVERAEKVLRRAVAAGKIKEADL
ncbi:HpcH/HpaI aldolase/citrate lyase family protein [Peptoniphilus grossensis]|uniref:HpcH/HpaI aldolase/citrate lyase family protein n=1 Tax=Peptoniphilus grossensis TaxID=1465756 RepID=UPI00399AE638